MAVSVRISTTLRSFLHHSSRLELEGGSVGEILQVLKKKYPEAGTALFDEEGRVRTFIGVYVNHVSTGQLEGLETKVSDGDEILLLPVIAGGACAKSVISDERRKEVTLDDKEIDRYGKHLLLREIGVKGQKRIKASKVLVAGGGSLGSPVVLYLAAAGVGTIGIADVDEVSIGNLQSQIAHGTRDINRPKTASVRDSVRAINPLVKVETYGVKLGGENIESILADYDVVVDATDNYTARYLINDACVLLGKPLVFGAMYQFEGYVAVYDARKGPCFRCQFPAPPPPGLIPTCAEGGVISALPGIIGSMQANEGSQYLGGQVRITDGVEFKADLKAYHEYLECQVKKHPNIDLKLGVRATPEMIRESDAETAIIAIGAKQRISNIPGSEKATPSMSAFHNPEKFGKRVVIIGGGHVGVELGIYLANGERKITVIDKNEFILQSAELSVRVSLLNEATKRKIDLFDSTEAVEILDDGVKVSNAEKGEYVIEADSVILAIGTEALVEQREGFRYSATDVIFVGDVLDDGLLDLPHAVETGFNAGFSV